MTTSVYRNRRSRQRFKQINMIPFIDIMLVMLAIVLTTASFVSKGVIPVNLPKAEHKLESQTGKAVVVISIDQEGQWYLDGQARSLEMIKMIIPKLHNRDGSRSSVVLEIDRASRFDEFFSLYNLLQAEKFTEIKLIATSATP